MLAIAPPTISAPGGRAWACALPETAKPLACRRFRRRAGDATVLCEAVRATDIIATPEENLVVGEASAVRPQIIERQRRGAHAKPRRLAPPPRDSRDVVVEFRGVSKLYGPGGIGLERATFAVRRQEMVFLVGPTGSGKSTIMRLLIKELDPSDGRIRVAGRDLADIDRKKVPYYRRNVGVVFQDFKLLPTRTVYDNIAYALQVTGAPRKQIRSTLPDILRLTGLSTKLHNYPHQLSGGEQQRVAVARAFASHPPLLLADEPTGNLDPETSIGIMQLLYRINRAGTTVIIASHDNEMVDRMRRRVIELKRGRIVRDEASGLYGAREENTDELGERLKKEVS
jgi:cell division transport system ATP-binding protein